MAQKVVELVLNYCNSRCPHFFHNYEDQDNIWCGKLNKKIFEGKDSDLLFFDFGERKIPKDCPLEDFK